MALAAAISLAKPNALQTLVFSDITPQSPRPLLASEEVRTVVETLTQHCAFALAHLGYRANTPEIAERRGKRDLVFSVYPSADFEARTRDH